MSKLQGKMYESGIDIGRLDSHDAYAVVTPGGTDLSFQNDTNGGQYLRNDRAENRYLGQDGTGSGSAQWNLGGGTWVYLQFVKSDGRIQSMGSKNKPTGFYLSKGDGQNLIFSGDSPSWVKWELV
jgi:hypothetical protein